MWSDVVIGAVLTKKGVRTGQDADAVGRSSGHGVGLSRPSCSGSTVCLAPELGSAQLHESRDSTQTRWNHQT